MPITIDRGVLTQKTAAELLDDASVHGKKFRAYSATMGPVPASTPVVIVALATSTALNDTQLNALETAIEGITGGGISVTKALVAASGVSPDSANTPTDHEVDLRVTGQLIPRYVAP